MSSMWEAISTQWASLGVHPLVVVVDEERGMIPSFESGEEELTRGFLDGDRCRCRRMGRRY